MPAASEAYIETLFELEQICCDQSHRIGAAVFMLDIMKTYAWSNSSLAFDFMDPTRDPRRRSHRIACLDQLIGVGCLDEHGLTPYLRLLYKELTSRYESDTESMYLDYDEGIAAMMSATALVSDTCKSLRFSQFGLCSGSPLVHPSEMTALNVDVSHGDGKSLRTLVDMKGAENPEIASSITTLYRSRKERKLLEKYWSGTFIRWRDTSKRIWPQHDIDKCLDQMTFHAPEVEMPGRAQQ